MEAPAPARQPAWLRSRAALALAVWLAAAVMCLFAWRMPKEVFWITDGGNRYIQVQSFARHGPPEILYPAADLDPELRFFPWAGHHFQRVGGQIVSYYLPYFALLSLPGYELAGAPGLYLLPLAAAIATLCLFPALLAAVGLAHLRVPATLGLGLATPLLFYGVTFWEHSLAVVLALAAVLMLLRAGRRQRSLDALLAGVLLGLSTVLREEGYVLVVAMLAAFLLSYRTPRSAAAFAGGWLGTLAPVWWLQYRLFESIFGIHAAAYGRLGKIDAMSAASAAAGAAGGAGDGSWLAQVAHQAGAKLGDLAFFLVSFHPNPWVAGALAVPFALVLAAGLRRRRGVTALDLWILGLATAASMVLVALLARDPHAVFDTLFTQGLLPHTPFLLFCLLGLRAQLAGPSPPGRFLAVACTLFALGVVVPLHRADVGIIWGPRHFLAVYPMLAVLALLAYRDLSQSAERPAHQRILAALGLLLALLGAVVESHGLRLLALKTAGTARILAAVRAAPGGAVVTDTYWLTEELAALYFERKFLHVESDADYREVLELLRRRGYVAATVVFSRQYGHLPRAAIADLRRRAISGQLVATPGLEFLDLAVVPVRLRDP